MHFNLWDTDTGNYFGRFEHEDEVLAVVRTLALRYGETYANWLSLGRVNDDGSFAEPLSGAELIAHAMAS